MANPAPTINQINAFNATQGTTIDFNIIGGTELVRSNRIYIYDLSDNSLICTHLYVSTESIHELPSNTDGSIVYESGKSSADFVNGAQYYAQIQTFTDIAGTEGGSGLSVAKMFWCLDDPTLTIDTIPSTISTTSYNVSATYNANTSVVSNIIQQYQFSLYSATGSLLQSSGVVVGNGEQQGTSTAYDISYNFTGLSVGSSYYTTVEVTTTQGMSVSAQSSTFTVSIDTPTLGEATVVNNACDGYISVTSNLSSEYGGSGSGEIVSFETDSENVFTKLQVDLDPTQSGSGTPSPSNVRPIYGVGGVDVNKSGKNLLPFPYAENTITRNGITWTVNDDGTITANGTSTGVSWFDVITASNIYYPKQQVKVSGCPNGGSASTYRIYINVKTKQGTNVGHTDTGSDSNVLDVAQINQVRLQILSTGFVANNLTFKPMIRGSNIADSTYEPYTETTVSQEFDVSLTPTSTDTDPYLFKALGDIYGDRLEEDIVGGTVCWNQLVTTTAGNMIDWSIDTTVSNNEVTITSNTNNVTFKGRVLTPLKNGHVYIGSCLLKSDGTAQIGSGFRQANGTNITPIESSLWSSPTAFTRQQRMAKPTDDTSVFGIMLKNDTASGSSGTFKEVNLTDLTAYFGNATVADAIYNMEQATAGSGIALLKASGFFNGYIPYDTGTLKSVNPTAHVTRGVNAWDEEWRIGAFNSNGEFVTGYNFVCSQNPIKVLPSTIYVTTKSILIWEFDADMNIIRSAASVVAGSAIRMEANVHYIHFRTNYETTTYNNDICINISNSEVNGQYFPYEEHTYDLGNVTLRGIPKLVNNELVYDGDTYESDGTVTRKYGIVDLGTLSWEYDSSFHVFRLGSNIGAIVPTAVGSVANLVCSKYPTMTQNALSTSADKFVSGLNWRYGVVVKDTSYSDAATFKSAMSGVMLCYEKATPTTETTTPFTQIQEVSKYGTLEYITTNDVPVGHNTTYYTRDIFGGHIDLVSGVLTVSHKLVDLGSLTWDTRESAGGTGVFIGTLPTDYKWANNVQALCSCYAYKGIIQQTAGASTHLGNGGCAIYYNSGVTKYLYPYVYICDTNFTGYTGAQVKSALSGQKLVYELDTPLTYQLTPQQIQTLVGVNNVWSEQGDIELSYHIPITNLLVKRQDVDDVSGNWLTLYSQPVEQASDMDFTFIDFLNQYGKTYKYALVPLLTQTQSGVEVEVEGGYTVSDEVQSIFDGVFISDSTGSQKCKANVGYGNVNMNQSVGSITPIGSQYPIIVTNSNNRYHNGSISGMIVPDDYYYNGNLSRIDMVNKRNELEQFLTNKRAKIIKDWNSNIWLVMIMDNIDCSFDNNYGMGIVTFNANWLEVGDPTNQEDLQATGLVDVGGV